MCGRYTLVNPDGLHERFEIVGTTETRIKPRFNIAPTQPVPVIVQTTEGRVLRLVRWGFQPFWMRDPKVAAPINARAESIATSGLFRGAFARQRCLIPADGFYEWRVVSGQKAKQPVHLRLKGQPLFAFAGLFTGDPDREDGDASCAIVTTVPNELAATVHDRMPVILDPADEACWIDPATIDPARIAPLLRSYPAERMEAFAVSRLVSSHVNDGPDLIEPVEEEPLRQPPLL